MSLYRPDPYFFRPLLYGFFSGVILAGLFYYSVFILTEKDFTFYYLWEFHKKYKLLYIINALPLAGIGLVYFFISKEKRSKEELTELLSKEKEGEKAALVFLEGLKSGRFTEAIEGDKSNDFLVSLDELRHTLQKNKEAEELRKKEDNQRNWASEGLAAFGEVLRQPGEDMEKFAFILISKLVKYLEANQGGFFIIVDEDKPEACLQMLACYAYDRKKFADRRIEWGTGLIGTCALEKKPVFLTKIPENYLQITSGLGKATPDYLLLLPLVTGNEVFGVIEIASFRRIENHQLAFCEKLSESIAMTISGLKNNQRTALLLKETRAQTEELALQEERMRQNMLELKATQEQAARQAEKFISFTNSVNHTMIRAEYDIDGILLYANTKFLRKMGFSGNKEVEGKHISNFIHEKDIEWFNSIWNKLSTGGEHFEGYMKHITKQGQDIWTMATYTCVRKDDGSVEKVLFLALDTTEYKKQSLDYEGQIEAINKLNLKAEFMPDGNMISSNELFRNSLKYPLQELELKSIYDFLNQKDIESFMDIWEKIIKGSAYQGQLRLNTRLDEEKWFRSTFTSVNDMYGEVSKVVFLANEITNERIMEIESRRQNELLKMQEEKLRFTSMELERKMKDIEAKWSEKNKNQEEKLKLTEKIIDSTELLILSVDNSGLLVYINEPACKYWKIKRKETIGLPASMVFEKSGNNYPEFFRDLLDPSKSKKEPDEPVMIPGAGAKSKMFLVKLITTEHAEKIIFSLILLEN